jgi:ABC-type transport system involved in Fe-S cluster assembly fused permease/ATPase subunit
MIARNIRRASMRGSSAVKNWARVHVFRTGTAVLTLALLGLSFFYSPDLLTWWLRTTMKIIESAAGLLPYPWGDRVEIAMKALGGSFWFLITSAIIMVRVVFWLVAVGWRHRPSRQRSNVDGGAF